MSTGNAISLFSLSKAISAGAINPDDKKGFKETRADLKAWEAEQSEDELPAKFRSE